MAREAQIPSRTSASSRSALPASSQRETTKGGSPCQSHDCHSQAELCFLRSFIKL